MRGEDFERGIRRLTKWFGKKDLSEAQRDTWFERIGHIPGQVFNQIIDQIIDQEKYMPTPGQIKNLFGEFKRIHPGQFMTSDQPQEDCDYCLGSGCIPAWRMMGQYSYHYLVPCGYCNNWRRFFPTRPSGPPAYIVPPNPMTVRELEAAGFTLYNPEQQQLTVKSTVQPEYANIDQMAESIGQEMPVQDDIPF
ncbi:MAG: hypothetical protein ACLFUL_06365 [Desulfobacteraceae bacterium]